MKWNQNILRILQRNTFKLSKMTYSCDPYADLEPSYNLSEDTKDYITK